MLERFKSYLNKNHLSGLAAIAGICLFYVILEGIGITCPILFLTGISCAGCGMSRAWLALLGGKIALAFSYHPLFWIPPIALLVWIFRKKLPQKVLWLLSWICCGLFMGVYVIRLLDPEDAVVVFHPEKGLIGKTITIAFDLLGIHF